MSSSAPDWAIYGSRCRDLIGQPECGLEVLIGWEPHARTHARTVFPERSEVADACVLQLVVCTSFLEGSSGVVATNPLSRPGQHGQEEGSISRGPIRIFLSKF